MKISFMAFIQHMTILEIFLKSILQTYFEFSKFKSIQSNPYDKLLPDVMKGNCDLVTVIWFKFKHILEAELDFPKVDYSYWESRFFRKRIKKLFRESQSEEIFREFDRSTDMINKIQKTMPFYHQYRHKMQIEKNSANRILLYLQLGLINGIQRIFCLLRLIELQKKMFVLQLEQG